MRLSTVNRRATSKNERRDYSRCWLRAIWGSRRSSLYIIVSSSVVASFPTSSSQFLPASGGVGGWVWCVWVGGWRGGGSDGGGGGDWEDVLVGISGAGGRINSAMLLYSLRAADVDTRIPIAAHAAPGSTAKGSRPRHTSP